MKAAPFPVYLGGAQVLENYPVGPTGGVAFNLTLLSYNGNLDMGLNIDTAAVAEPEPSTDGVAPRLRRAGGRRNLIGQDAGASATAATG